jgi:DEAD/DEAH box helicase domain-containing protein
LFLTTDNEAGNDTKFYVKVPPSAVQSISSLELNVEASVHAASHCLMSLLPKYVYSILGDVRTECKSPHATRPRPARQVV